jgi:hypothetical protein
MGDTIMSVGRRGLFLRLGTAPAGLVILGMRYPQSGAERRWPLTLRSQHSLFQGWESSLWATDPLGWAHYADL